MKTESILVRLTPEEKAQISAAATGPISTWARDVLVREAKRVVVAKEQNGGDDDTLWLEKLKETTKDMGPGEKLESQILAIVNNYILKLGWTPPQE